MSEIQTQENFHSLSGSEQISKQKDTFRVLMLTWEYPPRIVGGIARVVEGLSRALVRHNVEVHVITNEMPGSPMDELDLGVNVHRVSISSPAPSFHSWVLLMNHYFAKRAAILSQEIGKIDIVHAHDWLVLPAAAETKHFLRSKMVCTLHSLEHKRAGPSKSPESQMIESLEWWLTYESSIVIVCSNAMKSDAKWKYNIPEDKIEVIPIGIDSLKFTDFHPNRSEVRARYGVTGSEKLILFVGRLTQQKGCEYLIKAIPHVAKYYNVRLIVVGEGYLRSDLESQSRVTGEGSRIKFVGFISDEEVRNLMLSADLMVIPSIYEPFGVVALEAMAARTPVVASNVDGLGEIIKHEHSGILVYPKDPSSISWGISRVLSDQRNADRLVQNAVQEISSVYNWDAIANSILICYKKILNQ